MRIVEREGTGIKTAVNRSLKGLGVALIAYAGLLSSAQAAPVTVTSSDCGKLSVAIAASDHLLVGTGQLESGYALVGVQAYTGNEYEINAAGEGTGLTVNAAGEGTGAESSVDINAAGEGTGGESDVETNAAGEGTGGESSDPETNAAGEGTGSPEADAYSYWGWAEVLVSSDTTLDLIVYRQSDNGLSEYGVYSNVAVSGLASGNGCDRE